jgi:RNA polymerase sigma factor (sigma-70 family)
MAEEIMKRCNKCKVEKLLDEFSKDHNRKDGRQLRCKDCVSEYQHKRYAANRDHILEQQRKYYEANRDRIRERKRKWKAKYLPGRPANPEAMWTTHKGIAINHVKRFQMRYPDLLTFDEKLSVACIAMLQCMEKWDKSRGVKFVTYAYHAIRRELTRAMIKEMCYLQPGSTLDPGKYNIHFKQTSYQESPNIEGGISSDSIHAELYAADQIHYQHAEELIDFKRRTKRVHKNMKPRYRKGFKLMLEQGYTYSEAAKKVGVSREMMRQAWERSVERMLEYYEPTEATR